MAHELPTAARWRMSFPASSEPPTTWSVVEMDMSPQLGHKFNPIFYVLLLFTDDTQGSGALASGRETTDLLFVSCFIPYLPELAEARCNFRNVGHRRPRGPPNPTATWV